MPITQSRRKLSIGIWWKAFSFPFKNIPTLVRLGLIPGLIFLGVSFAILQLAHPTGLQLDSKEQLDEAFSKLSLASDIIDFLFFIPVIIFSVGIHRYIILGEPAKWVIFRFRIYEFMYLLVIVVFIIVIMVFLFVITTVSAIGIGLATGFENLKQTFPDFLQSSSAIFYLYIPLLVIECLTLWIYTKLILLYPHAAITGDLSLSASWRAIKGNFWRFSIAAFILVLVLFLIFATAFIFAVVALEVLQVDLSNFASENSPQKLNLFYTIYLIRAALAPVGFFVYAMLNALMAYAYMQLVDGDPSNTVGAPG